MQIESPVLQPFRLTPRQAAQALGISPTHVYRLIDNGRIPAVIDGGCKYVLTQALQRYLESLQPVTPTFAQPLTTKPLRGRPRKVPTTA